VNLAHIHLILNHVPVIGIPIALVFFLYGLYQKNASAQRFALLVLIGLAAAVVPVYFSGEPAEKVIEHLPGFAESFIESHEDAALFSLILTLITGVAALAALYFQKDPKKSRLLSFGVMGLACLAILSLLYTANLGGKVRHTELRSDPAVQAPGSGD
jgi:uncharacterized membrane protein